MKIVLTTAIIASLSLPAFAAGDKTHTPAQTETKSTKSQSVETRYPESVRSQVILGGLNENHKKFLLDLRSKRDLYN